MNKLPVSNKSREQQQRQLGRFTRDDLPRYSDEMRLASAFSGTGATVAAGGCRGSSAVRSVAISDLDHPPCNVHVLQTSVQPLRICIVAVISCVAVCAALVLATVAVTWWDSGKQHVELDHEHLHPAFRRPLARGEGPRARMQHYEKYANGRPFLHTFGLRQYGRRDDAEAHEEIDNKEPDDSYVKRKLNVNSMEVEKATDYTKLTEVAEESVTKLKSTPALNNTNKELVEKAVKHLDNKRQLQPEHEYDLTLSRPDRRIEKKDQPDEELHLDPVIIPDFRPSLPDVIPTKVAALRLPDGYLAGLRKYDEDYYDTNEYLYLDDTYYYDNDKNTLTSYLIQKVKELYNWITNDPDLEGPGRQDDGNNDFSDILTALNDSIVLGNVSIIFAKIRQIYEADNGTADVDLSKSRLIVSNSSNLVSLGLLALDVMLLHNVQLLAWDEQKYAKEEMLSENDVFAFNAIFMDPEKVKPLYEDFQQNRQMAARKRFVEVESKTPSNRSVLENVLDLGLSTARAALYLSRAYNNARAAFNHARHIQHKSDGHPKGLRSPQTRISLYGHRMSKPLAGRIAIKIDGKVALDEDDRDEGATERTLHHAAIACRVRHDIWLEREPVGGFAARVFLESLHSFPKKGLTSEFTELDCMWNLYCRNLDRTSKLSGPYGMLAKVNGLGLRLLVGEFPIEKALDTLLVDAVAGWRQLDCDRMFSKCSGEFASKVILESLIGKNRFLISADHGNEIK